MSHPDIRRTLFMCAYPPSGISGGAVILRNLLRDFPPDRLWMLLSEANVRAAEEREGRPLQWRHAVAPWPVLDGRIRGKLRHPVRAALIPVIAAKAARTIRRERIEAIFAVQFYGEFFIAAYLAHRWTGCPLYAFSMDDWLSNAGHHGWTLQRLASRYMPRIAKEATCLWGISPDMVEEWQRLYGVRADVLWHSVDLRPFREAVPQPREDGGFVVVNLGTIYSVNEEPFRELLAATHSLRADGSMAPGLRVRLYTSQSLELLAQSGITPGRYLEIGSVSEADVPRVLADADIAFLPLSFDPRWRRVVEVAFPTKLAEYLAAGKPVLVYAPASATAARYVREYDCGLVVDRPDPEALLATLQRLMSDGDLRERLARNARAVAERNHDRSKVVAGFLSAFERERPGATDRSSPPGGESPPPA